MDDSSENRDKVWIMNGDPEEGYLMSGKLMLSSILILFAAVILMVGVHLLAKRYIGRLRRRQYERRRDRLVSRSQVLMYIDSLSVGDRGLERQVLNSLPLYFYTPKHNQAPTECAVCLSEFEFKDVVRLLPNCNHCFHIECIDTWFRSHSTCPICRSLVIRPVWKLNVGSSTGEEVEGGNGDGCGSRTRMELVEVRVEMPPWRVAVENEISQNAVANELSLTRIPTVEALPPLISGVGGGGSV